MKVFLISNMYPSKKDSIFGVFVKNFKRELESKGVVFSAISVINGKKPNNFQKLFAYLKFYLSISYNFLFKKYDLIYVHNMSHTSPILAPLLFIFKKKRPLVMNVHGDDVTGSKGKKIDILNKYVLNRTELVVVPSDYFKSTMFENYPFLTPDQVFTSASGGVDNSKFYPLEEEINPIPIIGMVSRIDEGKGWDDLLKALKLLKEKGIKFKALIAGQGLQEKGMKKMILDFNLATDVEFLGLVKQEQLVHLYNKMDIFIFPTKREGESLGLVGLEAMSCKTPVIGGDIGGLKTYIKNGVNGMLFQPGNVLELAESIEKYLNFSSKEKTDMKNAAFETAKDYESSYVIERLLQQLKKVCIEN
ncbi:MAG: glycosyltransferase [Aequorivita sp.]